MDVLQNPQNPETQNPQTQIPQNQNPEISKTEIWQAKRERINRKRRERRQKQKEENPEYLANRQEQRQKQKEEDPEYTTRESAKRQDRRKKQDLERLKQQHQNERRQMFNDLFDSYFEQNKHTFPTPVSPKLWEKLKKDEIDFEISTFGNSTTMKDLHEYRQDQIDFLRANPNHPCAASIIFYIKTLVHRPKDQRKLTDEEKDYVNSLVISPLKVSLETKKYDYYEKKKEYYKENKKQNYEKKKSDQKNYNLNIRFMKEDPNKVLSIDDITMNPFVSNFSQREEFKINLWKQDRNPEYLEKWKKQREDYEKEVAELSVEYKTDFLKNKWLVQS